MLHSDSELEDLRDAIQEFQFWSSASGLQHDSKERRAHLDKAWKCVEHITARPIDVPGEDPAAWTHRLKMAAWKVLTHSPSAQQSIADEALAHLRECQDILRVIQKQRAVPNRSTKTQTVQPTVAGTIDVTPLRFIVNFLQELTAIEDEMHRRADNTTHSGLEPVSKLGLNL